MYKKRSTYEMKERAYYTTHTLLDSVQISANEDSLRRLEFAYFVDSTPFSRYDVRKNKKGRVTRVKAARNDVNRDAYKRRKDLIAEYDYLPGFNKAHWIRKNDDLRMIKMEDQYIPPEDTTDTIEEGFFVADDFVETDSLTSDSTAVAEVPAEPERPTEIYRFGYGFQNNKFNSDQEYYNKEFGHLLVLKVPPAPEVEEEIASEELSESDSTVVKKKGFGGLFKKKKKKEEEEEPEEEIEEN
ncbi:MAG: hypothetical protein RJQ09_18795 [Cyclobacteriaceae bacterium]